MALSHNAAIITELGSAASSALPYDCASTGWYSEPNEGMGLAETSPDRNK